MTPDARAARERKQKIFVLAGGLFLVALLAIQLPKLLGGSSPAAAATTTDTTTPEQAAPAPAGTTTPVSVVGAAPTSAATTEKLTSFTVFAPKDPFVQQVVTQTRRSPSREVQPRRPQRAEARRPRRRLRRSRTGEQAAAAVTIVTVNGARQIVEPGMKFPAGDPLFVLVAEKPGSKSVVVGIAGGAYTGGHKTATLKVGKPLTLVNTTTGARYKISLVSVGSGEADQPAPKP